MASHHWGTLIHGDFFFFHFWISFTLIPFFVWRLVCRHTWYRYSERNKLHMGKETPWLGRNAFHFVGSILNGHEVFASICSFVCSMFPLTTIKSSSLHMLWSQDVVLVCLFCVLLEILFEIHSYIADKGIWTHILLWRGVVIPFELMFHGTPMPINGEEKAHKWKQMKEKI